MSKLEPIIMRDGWCLHLETRHVESTPEQLEALESVLRGETVEEWLERHEQAG